MSVSRPCRSSGLSTTSSLTGLGVYLIAFLAVTSYRMWCIADQLDGDGIARFCTLNESYIEHLTKPCSEMQTLNFDGYNLDRRLSELTRMTKRNLAIKLLEWAIHPETSPNCVYVRSMTRSVQGCCMGWTGTSCNEPACQPPCANGGVCTGPSTCQCISPYVGLTCQDDSTLVNDTVAFCYAHATCSGPKALGFEAGVVNQSQCCGDGTRPFGWGLTGSKCDTCLGGSIPQTDFGLDKFIVVPNTPESPLHRTCAGIGPYIWRTFDGIDWSFAGSCVYTLYSDGTVTVTVDMAGCTGHFNCKKILTIRLNENNAIVAQGANITVAGQQVYVNALHGYAKPFAGFRIEQTGDYIQLECGTLIVTWDIYGNNWKIFASFNFVSSNETKIRGLCGDDNGNPSDDIKSRSGASLTDQTAFGNSWADASKPDHICFPSSPYTTPVVSPIVEMMANEYCGVILKFPFNSCHLLVSVSRYFARCYTDYCNARQSSKSPADLASELDAVRCDLLTAYSQACSEVTSSGFTWRNASFCPRSCPPTMHYSECQSPCSRTCSNVYGAAAAAAWCATDSTCVAGCECATGAYLTTVDDVNDNVTSRQGPSIADPVCVPLDECHCTYRGQSYPPRSSVAIGCNDCICIFGRWNCTTAVCSKTCSVLGTQHITTFDGLHYDFQGPECSYVLVESLVPRSGVDQRQANRLTISYSVDTSVPASAVNRILSIRVQFTVNAGNTTGNESSPSSQSFDVVIDRHFLFQVNGRVIEDPLFHPFESQWIHVSLESELFAAVRGPGFQVLYERGGRIYVRLDPIHRKKIRGLCGNMDGSIDNDWKSRSGIVEIHLDSFVTSYSECPRSSGAVTRMTDTCLAASRSNVDYANTQCLRVGQLGIFDDCLRAVVDWQVYRDWCIKDACANPSSTAVCTMVAALAYRCAGRNLVIDWMADMANYCGGIAGYGCPVGSSQRYTDCLPSPKLCRDVRSNGGGEADLDLPGLGSLGSATGADYGSCIQGCACAEGELLDDRRTCASRENCTCYDNYSGTVVDAGETAHRLCGICRCSNGNWDCNGIECSENVRCPSNQVYMRNIRNCGLSCSTYDSPGYCSAEEYDGCTCPDGTILNENGTCVAPEDCPCAYNERLYQPNELVTVGCAKYVCLNRQWTYSEQVGNCRGVCWATGDPHYKTFDGQFFTFQGGCEYVLVRSKDSATDAGLPSVLVTAENVQCGYGGVTCTKELSASVNNVTVGLTVGQKPTVDGSELDIGSVKVFDRSFDGGRISSNQLFVFVSFYENGLSIAWDRGTRAYISLPTAYRGHVEGMCGDFDNIFANDLTPGGIGGSVEDFGSLWKTKTSCADPAGPVEYPPCRNNSVLLSWATRSCLIIKTSELFEVCRRVVNNYEDFYHNCVIDSCSCDEGVNCECMCTAIASFAAECNAHGVFVHWRSNDLCPVMCEGDSQYHPCAAPCPMTCRNAAIPRNDDCERAACAEGCLCPPNSVVSDIGACVPLTECTCVYGENVFPATTVIEVNCQRCTCTNGTFVCMGRNCHSNCSADEYRCPGDDRCIPLKHRCDGIVDCRGSEDELGCPCEIGEYRCTDGTSCIDFHLVCNQQTDCADGSDELDCDSNCSGVDQVQCSGSDRCVSRDRVCDGYPDCGWHDATDELNCTGISTTLRPETTCPAGQHLIALSYGSSEFSITLNGGDGPPADLALLGSNDALTIRRVAGDVVSLSVARRQFSPDLSTFGLRSVSFMVNGVDNVTINSGGGSSETFPVRVELSWTQISVLIGLNQPHETQQIEVYLLGVSQLIHVKDFTMAACITPEKRCLVPLNVAYSSVHSSTAFVSAIRDDQGVQAALLEPWNAFRGSGVHWQWPTASPTTHTFSVRPGTPCELGTGDWTVMRLMFTTEGVKEFRVLMGGITVVPDTQIIADNPYTFLVSEEHHLSGGIEIKLVPSSQIMKLYNVELAMCCGLTEIVDATQEPTPPLVCEKSLSIGRDTSHLADIVAVCSVGSTTNVASIVDTDWISLPVNLNNETGVLEACPVLVRPLIDCPEYKFDYIGFEIRGTDRLRLVVDGTVIVDWIAVQNRGKFQQYGQFRGHDLSIQFGKPSNTTDGVHMRNLLVQLCCCNSSVTAVTPLPLMTCTNRVTIDATSSLDFQATLTSERLGPLENADAGLKFSPDLAGRISVSSSGLYRYTIRINEPCTTGPWRILSYGFMVEKVSRYRVTIGSQLPDGWVSYPILMTVPGSRDTVNVQREANGDRFSIEFHGNTEGLMSINEIQLQVCCPVAVTKPTCVAGECSSTETTISQTGSTSGTSEPSSTAETSDSSIASSPGTTSVGSSTATGTITQTSSVEFTTESATIMTSSEMISGNTGIGTTTVVSASSGNTVTGTTSVVSASSGNTVTGTTTVESASSGNTGIGTTTVVSASSGNTVTGTTSVESASSGNTGTSTTTVASASSGNTVTGTTTVESASSGNTGIGTTTVVSASSGNTVTGTTSVESASSGNTGTSTTTVASASSGNTGTGITTVESASSGNTGTGTTTVASASSGNTGTGTTTVESASSGNTGTGTTTVASASSGNTGTDTTTVESASSGSTGTGTTTMESASSGSTGGGTTTVGSTFSSNIATDTTTVESASSASTGTGTSTVVSASSGNTGTGTSTEESASSGSTGTGTTTVESAYSASTGTGTSTVGSASSGNTGTGTTTVASASSGNTETGTTTVASASSGNTETGTTTVASASSGNIETGTTTVASASSGNTETGTTIVASASSGNTETGTTIVESTSYSNTGTASATVVFATNGNAGTSVTSVGSVSSGITGTHTSSSETATSGTLGTETASSTSTGSVTLTTMVSPSGSASVQPESSETSTSTSSASTSRVSDSTQFRSESTGSSATFSLTTEPVTATEFSSSSAVTSEVISSGASSTGESTTTSPGGITGTSPGQTTGTSEVLTTASISGTKATETSSRVTETSTLGSETTETSIPTTETSTETTETSTTETSTETTETSTMETTSSQTTETSMFMSDTTETSSQTSDLSSRTLETSASVSNTVSTISGATRTPISDTATTTLISADTSISTETTIGRLTPEQVTSTGSTTEFAGSTEERATGLTSEVTSPTFEGATTLDPLGKTRSSFTSSPMTSGATTASPIESTSSATSTVSGGTGVSASSYVTETTAEQSSSGKTLTSGETGTTSTRTSGETGTTSTSGLTTGKQEITSQTSMSGISTAGGATSTITNTMSGSSTSISQEFSSSSLGDVSSSATVEETSGTSMSSEFTGSTKSMSSERTSSSRTTPEVSSTESTSTGKSSESSVITATFPSISESVSSQSSERSSSGTASGSTVTSSGTTITSAGQSESTQFGESSMISHRTRETPGNNVERTETGRTSTSPQTTRTSADRTSSTFVSGSTATGNGETTTTTSLSESSSAESSTTETVYDSQSPTGTVTSQLLSGTETAGRTTPAGSTSATDVTGTSTGTTSAGSTSATDVTGTSTGTTSAGSTSATDVTGTSTGTTSAGSTLATDVTGTSTGTTSAGSTSATDVTGTSTGTTSAGSTSATDVTGTSTGTTSSGTTSEPTSFTSGATTTPVSSTGSVDTVSTSASSSGSSLTTEDSGTSTETTLTGLASSASKISETSTSVSGSTSTESLETSTSYSGRSGLPCGIATDYYSLTDPFNIPCNPPISVPRSICRGDCLVDSRAVGAVIALNDSLVISSRPIVRYSCPCCTDEAGHWELMSITCSAIERRYQIYKMTSCSCNDCQRVSSSSVDALPRE